LLPFLTAIRALDCKAPKPEPDGLGLLEQRSF